MVWSFQELPGVQESHIPVHVGKGLFRIAQLMKGLSTPEKVVGIFGLIRDPVRALAYLFVYITQYLGTQATHLGADVLAADERLQALAGSFEIISLHPPVDLGEGACVAGSLIPQTLKATSIPQQERYDQSKQERQGHQGNSHLAGMPAQKRLHEIKRAGRPSRNRLTV